MRVTPSCQNRGMAHTTLYEVLDVDRTADSTEIAASYRRLVSLVHPDHGGSHALFRDVQEAYETLSDPEKRAAYDDSLRHPGRGGFSRPDSAPTAWDQAEGAQGSWEEPPGQPDPDPGYGPGEWPYGRARPGTGGDGSWTGPGTDGAPGTGHSCQGTASIIIARHPAAFTGLLGFLVLGFSAGITALTLVGMLLLFTGLVAGIGGHSLRRRKTIGFAVFLQDTPIETLNAGQLEQLVAELLARAGCAVHRVNRVRGPGGTAAALVIGAPEQCTIVEIKRSTLPLGGKAVEQVLHAMAPYQAAGAMVVTNSVFTDHAVVLARENGVLLWDRDDLWNEMVRSSLHAPLPAELGWALLAQELRVGISALIRAAGVAIFGLIVAAVISGSRHKR